MTFHPENLLCFVSEYQKKEDNCLHIITRFSNLKASGAQPSSLNRSLNEERAAILAESIFKEGIVYGTFSLAFISEEPGFCSIDIMDGQHRFWALDILLKDRQFNPIVHIFVKKFFGPNQTKHLVRYFNLVNSHTPLHPEEFRDDILPEVVNELNKHFGKVNKHFGKVIRGDAIHTTKRPYIHCPSFLTAGKKFFSGRVRAHYDIDFIVTSIVKYNQKLISNGSGEWSKLDEGITIPMIKTVDGKLQFVLGLIKKENYYTHIFEQIFGDA